MASTSWDTLSTSLAAKIAASDLATDEKSLATAYLERWIAAEKAYDDFSSAMISGYSIAGRSVSKFQVNAALTAKNTAKLELSSLLYGSEAHADFRNYAGEAGVD